MARIVSNNLQQKVDVINQANQIKSKVDLNLIGYNRKKKNAISVYDDKAVANQVKLWLMSEPDDLIRESNEANYKYTLYNLIGMIVNNKSLSEAEDQLINQYNIRGYATDLEMKYIHLSTDSLTRTIYVDFIVQDKVTSQILAGRTDIEI